MGFDFGYIARRVCDALAGTLPPPQPVRLIDGGPNAPELAQRPKDIDRTAGLPADQGPWDAEVKIDGIRCLFADNLLFTLQGQPMNCARHCVEGLMQLEQRYGEPMFFDGEYVEEEGFEATNTAFKKGEGMGVLWLFDAMPLREWKANACTTPRWQRKAALIENVQAVGSRWVGALDDFPIDSVADLHTLFMRIQAHGHEGLVCKRQDSIYDRARNGDWLRMKPDDTTDMLLVDIEGTDKGGAKRLVLRDPSGPVILTTGFASVRHVLWVNRDLFLGQDDQGGVMVEVRHNGRTAKGKPRHARFSKLREDKAAPGAFEQERSA